jgi:hypothetical protein
VAILLGFRMLDRRETRQAIAQAERHAAEVRAIEAGRFIASTTLRAAAVESGYSLGDPAVIARINETIDRHTPRRNGATR